MQAIDDRHGLTKPSISSPYVSEHILKLRGDDVALMHSLQCTRTTGSTGNVVSNTVTMNGNLDVDASLMIDVIKNTIANNKADGYHVNFKNEQGTNANLVINFPEPSGYRIALMRYGRVEFISDAFSLKYTVGKSGGSVALTFKYSARNNELIVNVFANGAEMVYPINGNELRYVMKSGTCTITDSNVTSVRLVRSFMDAMTSSRPCITLNTIPTLYSNTVEVDNGTSNVQVSVGVLRLLPEASGVKMNVFYITSDGCDGLSGLVNFLTIPVQTNGPEDPQIDIFITVSTVINVLVRAPNTPLYLLKGASALPVL